MFKYNLTHMSEDELRKVLDDLLDMSASLPEEEFQAEITSFDRVTILNTHLEVVVFREGFIMSRISAFERMAEKPWKPKADKTLLN